MVHSNRMIKLTSKADIGQCRWLTCRHAVETLTRRTPYRRVQCKAAPSDVFILDVGVLLNNTEEVCEPLARPGGLARYQKCYDLFFKIHDALNSSHIEQGFNLTHGPACRRFQELRQP